MKALLAGRDEGMKEGWSRAGDVRCQKAPSPAVSAVMRLFTHLDGYCNTVNNTILPVLPRVEVPYPKGKIGSKDS